MNEEKLVKCYYHELMPDWRIKPIYRIVAQFYDSIFQCYFIAEKDLFYAYRYKGDAQIKYFRNQVKKFIRFMEGWCNYYVPFENLQLSYDRLRLKTYVELGDYCKPVCFMAYGAEITADKFQENYMEYDEDNDCYYPTERDPFKEN